MLYVKKNVEKTERSLEARRMVFGRYMIHELRDCYQAVKFLKFIIIKIIIWNRHKCLLFTLFRIKIYVYLLAVIFQDVCPR